MRRRTALLALAAIVLHAAAPFMATAAPRTGKETIELCTAHGIVAVKVDAEGPYAPHASQRGPDCACHGMAPGGARASALAAAAPTALAMENPRTCFPASPRTAARPRAPPLPA